MPTTAQSGPAPSSDPLCAPESASVVRARFADLGHEPTRGRVVSRELPAPQPPRAAREGAGSAARRRAGHGSGPGPRAPMLPRPASTTAGALRRTSRKPHRTTSSPVLRSRSSRTFSASTSRAAASPLGPSRVELTEVLPGAVRLGDRAVLAPHPVDPAQRTGPARRTRPPGSPAAGTPSCHSRVKEHDSSHVSRRGSISAMPSSAARMPGQWRCWRRSLRSSRTVSARRRTAASATATASGSGSSRRQSITVRPGVVTRRPVTAA